MAIESSDVEGPFSESKTTVAEITSGIYRIATSVPPKHFPGGFSYGQFLILDEEPLLFHSGPRRMFSCVVRGLEELLPVDKLRWLSFGHGESDESGAMNEILAAAPDCQVVVGQMLANLVVEDAAIRPPRVLQHGETMRLGQHEVMWMDTPHLPHNWEAGLLFETTTRTLMCGDLFTQFGEQHPALTAEDILVPSEAVRGKVNFYSNPNAARPILEELANLEPAYLATMHGPTWQGDGATMLRRLADALEATPTTT